MPQARLFERELFAAMPCNTCGRFDQCRIKQKSGANQDAATNGKLAFESVYCITLVQTLSIKDWALGEQVGAKKTFKFAGGLISGADFSSSE